MLRRGLMLAAWTLALAGVLAALAMERRVAEARAVAAGYVGLAETLAAEEQALRDAPRRSRLSLADLLALLRAGATRARPIESDRDDMSRFEVTFRRLSRHGLLDYLARVRAKSPALFLLELRMQALGRNSDRPRDEWRWALEFGRLEPSAN